MSSLGYRGFKSVGDERGERIGNRLLREMRESTERMERGEMRESIERMEMKEMRELRGF